MSVPDRRKGDRRQLPSQNIDVTRLEHENLCRQMDEALRMLRRIETELRAQGERIAALEQRRTSSASGRLSQEQTAG
jgi:hypothetical protein